MRIVPDQPCASIASANSCPSRMRCPVYTHSNGAVPPAPVLSSIQSTCVIRPGTVTVRREGRSRSWSVSGLSGAPTRECATCLAPLWPAPSRARSLAESERDRVRVRLRLPPPTVAVPGPLAAAAAAAPGSADAAAAASGDATKDAGSLPPSGESCRALALADALALPTATSCTVFAGG